MYKLLSSYFPVQERVVSSSYNLDGFESNVDFRCFDRSSVQFKFICNYIRHLVAGSLDSGIVDVHAVESRFFDRFPFMRHIHNSVDSVPTPLLKNLSEKVELYSQSAMRARANTTSQVHNTIQMDLVGLGVSGSVLALMLSKMPNVKVNAHETRTDGAEKGSYALRAGSLSFKAHEFFKGLFTSEEWVEFRNITPIGFFPEGHSTGAVRLPICSYQRGTRTIFSRTGNIALNFKSHVEPRSLSGAIVVDSTGHSKSNSILDFREFAVSAATGYSFISDSTYSNGLIMESGYSATGLEHRRIHTGVPAQFKNELLALQSLGKLSEEKVHQFLTCKKLSFVYHMKLISPQELSRNKGRARFSTPGVIANPPFQVFPTINEQSVIFEGERLRLCIGDSSGNVNFVGGFGQSKAAIQMRILKDYMDHLQVIKYLDIRSDLRKEYLKALQEWLEESMLEVNTRYFWIAVVDSIYSQEVMARSSAGNP